MDQSSVPWVQCQTLKTGGLGKRMVICQTDVLLVHTHASQSLAMHGACMPDANVAIMGKPNIA